MKASNDNRPPGRRLIGPCPGCQGDGRITARRSGDWQRDPERYAPDQLVPCPVCGGSGLIPNPGSFEEV